jgi:NAD(P)-dependent dehydrogenase (short-subunit alcohol dehydrogenase family)
LTGASSGIGRAAAIEFARRGWGVGLLARRADALAQTADAAKQAGAPVAEAIPCDVSDQAALAAAIRSLTASLGAAGAPVAALVNCAGLARLVPFMETDAPLFEQAFRINTLAPALAIQAAWPALCAAETGRIINVSSYASDDPFPGFTAYGASKGALDVVTKSVANEGEAERILAFSVAPGAVETAMLRAVFDEAAAPTDICLATEDVASLIVDCAAGARDDDNGRVLYIRRDESGGVEIKVQPRMSES